MIKEASLQLKLIGPKIQYNLRKLLVIFDIFPRFW